MVSSFCEIEGAEIDRLEVLKMTGRKHLKGLHLVSGMKAHRTAPLLFSAALIQGDLHAQRRGLVVLQIEPPQIRGGVAIPAAGRVNRRLENNRIMTKHLSGNTHPDKRVRIIFVAGRMRECDILSLS